MKHGLSGFQSGCRCAACQSAESERMHRISAQQTHKWNALNKYADEQWERLQNKNWIEYSGREWTPEEIDYALDRSRTCNEIAKDLGRTADAVKAMRCQQRPHS
ncbi:hypothetical protein [Mycobacteroides chelonae]|uniref:hypothetical protein n=1 Tax=Mycobacteroides chelonae TaxID=1774 RepID=UPI0010420C7C|nr:hypothetical protein [Mycobacteroides chelonae]